MRKSVIQSLFNYSGAFKSPVIDDFERVEKRSDDSVDVVYQKVDYPSVQQSHGKVTDWSLNSLLKAGVNPQFSIHTGFGTRLEGVSELQKLSAVADAVLAPSAESPNEPSNE